MTAIESSRCGSPLQETTLYNPRVNVVPLVTPRYQKKQRAHRLIQVTDSSEGRKTATEALQEHTKELLTVQDGKTTYEQEMYFHPYELFKHGKHKIHSRSVGYSSAGDLVLIRESVSEPSDVDLGYVQRRAEIDNAVCLNPKAQRPVSGKEDRKKLRYNPQGFRKYPGIRAPKNRKTRNRLLNDYFVSKYSKAIVEKFRERLSNGEAQKDLSPEWRPSFAELPPVFDGDFFDLEEDAQTQALEKSGVNVSFSKRSPIYPSRDLNSGEARFQGLSCRLRGELIHALNSEFLTRQIEDLENAFSKFILTADTNETLTYRFRDGYGRLVCHGVSAYYQLVSESQQQGDGSKITIVSWPKKKRNSGCLLALPQVSLMQMLRKSRGDMGWKYNCSASSTPQSTPCFNIQQPDILPDSFDLDGRTSSTVQSPTGKDWPTDVEHGSPKGKNTIKGEVALYEAPLRGSSNTAASKKKKHRKCTNANDAQQTDARKESP